MEKKYGYNKKGLSFYIADLKWKKEGGVEGMDGVRSAYEQQE
jgi:hypothetical protein